MKNEIVKVTPTETGLTKYIPPAEFFATFSPSKCMDLFNKQTTMELAIKTETYSLAKINKMYNRELAIEYVKLWIIDLNKDMNVKRGMSETQIEKTAKMLYDEYYYMNLAELNKVFTDIQKGIYGEVYDMLNCAKILGFMRIYAKERVEWFFDDALRNHDNTKRYEVQQKRFLQSKDEKFNQYLKDYQISEMKKSIELNKE